MNKSQPLVSVIIPIYNVEKYIAAAIDSVLEQSYDNFELLLIDDESPDSSVEIAKSYTDQRIQIISQINRGLAGARNTGLNAAKGQYIALLDADDLWHPDKLTKHVEHLANNLDIDISYCPSLFIDEQGRTIGQGQFPKLTKITSNEILCRNPVGNGSAPVIRKRLLDKIKQAEKKGKYQRTLYFDERLRQSEDIEFWLRCSLSFDAKFEGIKTPLTYYRLNQQGLSANLEQQLESWYRAIFYNEDKYRTFFSKYFVTAKAYQYRYLARRAIHSNMPTEALSYSKKALQTDIKILFQEPIRTATTHICSLLLFHFTKPFSWFTKQYFGSQ